MESLFNAVKIELSLKDVPCILIRPGAIQTKILNDTIHFKVLESESLFDKEFRRFVKTAPKYIGKRAKPCDIASVVLKAGLSKRPKPVYQMNHNPLVSVLSYLPRRIQHYIIKNSLK